MTSSILWSTFVVALAASVVLSPLVRMLAIRIGLVDRPDPRKVHAVPMPLLGGLAVYLSVVIAFTALSFTASGRASIAAMSVFQLVAVFGSTTMLLVVGLFDDAGRLHHQVKLMIAMPIAAACVLASGIRLHAFEDSALGLVGNGALSFIWIVGITAAFSILDHMDGLCAGTAGFAAAAFCVIGWWSGDALAACLAAGVCGAAIGFLRINFNPAKMFMGDAGAMCLGFLTAVLGLCVESPTLGAWQLALPVLVLAVPVLDTSLVIVSRSRRGLVPFSSPGKDHAAHRLSNLGLGHRGAVLVIYAVGLIGAATALIAARSGTGVAQIAAIAGLVLGVLIIFVLEKAPYDRQSASK